MVVDCDLVTDSNTSSSTSRRKPACNAGIRSNITFSPGTVRRVGIQREIASPTTPLPETSQNNTAKVNSNVPCGVRHPVCKLNRTQLNSPT